MLISILTCTEMEYINDVSTRALIVCELVRCDMVYTFAFTTLYYFLMDEMSAS